MRNLYAELAEYTGRTQVLCEARCIHASVELAWQFEENKHDPIKHYRESDLYIFALTRYQMQLQVNNIHSWYQEMIKSYGWKTGFDFGGGIGEQTILACEKGVKMCFLEVDESKTMDYARWRFRKHVFEPEMYEEHYGIERDFDFIVAMDVFEHLEKPEPIIEAIAKHTKYLFCNPGQVKYNWLYPQHISQFSIEQYFKKVDLYLYERRK